MRVTKEIVRDFMDVYAKDFPVILHYEMLASNIPLVMAINHTFGVWLYKFVFRRTKAKFVVAYQMQNKLFKVLSFKKSILAILHKLEKDSGIDLYLKENLGKMKV